MHSTNTSYFHANWVVSSMILKCLCMCMYMYRCTCVYMCLCEVKYWDLKDGERSVRSATSGETCCHADYWLYLGFRAKDKPNHLTAGSVRSFLQEIQGITSGVANERLLPSVCRCWECVCIWSGRRSPPSDDAVWSPEWKKLPLPGYRLSDCVRELSARVHAT